MKNIYLKAVLKALSWMFSAVLVFAACNQLDIYVIGKNNPTVRTLEVSGDNMDENSAELTGSVRWEQSASDHSFDCLFAVSMSPDFPAGETETFSIRRMYISQDDTATHYYNVTADGLEAGTTYYYVFSITEGVVEVSGEVRSFTTPGSQTEDTYEIVVSNELNEVFSIAIEMQSDWWIENTAGWFSVSPLSGEAGLCEIAVQVIEVNTGNAERSAEFVIYDGDRLIYVTVIQPAWETVGELNGHEWVDLGLSVRWATCNVGASIPLEYGDYYAWGEIETKTEYTEENSLTYGVELGDISGWTFLFFDGMAGYNVTGPNGISIFLPAAGGCYFLTYTWGCYWSSTPSESDQQYTYGLHFDSGSDCGHHVVLYNRYNGLSVRPVTDK